MFSLVCALPSPASAEACASLFDWFTGTTAQSDFSSTCMSAVWFMAFADRSCSFEQDVREISRFSCMLFLSVRGFSDYAGPDSHSRNSVAAVLPSSISEGSRHPDPSAFRSSIARPTGTSGLRFTRHLTVPPARLEARMESLFSFPVGLFHPLQHAGLSRRTPSGRKWPELSAFRDRMLSSIQGLVHLLDTSIFTDPVNCSIMSAKLRLRQRLGV